MLIWWLINKVQWWLIKKKVQCRKHLCSEEIFCIIFWVLAVIVLYGGHRRTTREMLKWGRNNLWITFLSRRHISQLGGYFIYNLLFVMLLCKWNWECKWNLNGEIFKVFWELTATDKLYNLGWGIYLEQLLHSCIGYLHLSVHFISHTCFISLVNV